MTSEQWARVERLYHKAGEQPREARREWLARECGDDNVVRREVESLLAQNASSDDLLDGSALSQISGSGNGDATLIGQRVGSYEIAALVDEGGMGQVYRARDLTLPRDVAVKVIPPALAHDPARRARLRQEAELLASLSHPHIAHVYAFVEDGEQALLVMEFVGGRTLAERIALGPMPLAEALPVARQLADALDAAHEQGVVHRDLKPANVKIMSDGAVKVLDFGLAAPVRRPMNGGSPREPGSLIGTAAYLSPERTRGESDDRRSDIWAFGCVLFEMLTGRQAFSGATVTEILSAILEREPEWSALPSSFPEGVRTLLRRCLDKDPRRRLRDIGEARVLLDDLISAPPAVATRRLRDIGEARAEIDDAQHGRAWHDDSPRPIFRPWLVATFMGVALLGVAAAAFLVGTRVRPPAASVEDAARFLVGVTPADAFGPGPTRANPRFPYPARTDVALSPDGTLLVFSARKDGRQQLYLRALNQLDATPIAGTEDSNSPFFSPDGQWLGFWTGAVDVGATGELKKMRLDGTPAVPLARVPPLRGATWGSDEIVFAVTDGERLLWRVPASGGVPHTLTLRDDPNDRRNHSLPQMLPDGRGVLYTIGTVESNFADGEVVVMSLATGETHVVLDRGVDARYVPSGHLVYVRDGTLMAAPFDLEGLRVTGTPAPIEKGVMQAVRTTSRSLSETGAAQFSVSNSGTLVYVPSAPVPELLWSPVWVSRNGRVTPSTLPLGAYGGPRLSPDGQRVALFTLARGTLIHDLARGGLMSVAPDKIWPTFTPDGKRITLGDPSGFVSMSLEGGATDRFAVDGVKVAGSWSPDDQTLLFTKLVGDGVWEIRALSRTGGDRKVHPSGNAAVNERFPQFSPDGEWFVYSSNEQGAEEVFVERYRGAAERYPISTNGGTAPAWAPSGREVFYLAAAPEGRISMMAVDVTLRPKFVAGRPHVLFEGRYGVGSPHRHYDVARDGRFLMVRGPEGPPAPPVTQMVMVLNWFEELKRLAPSNR